MPRSDAAAALKHGGSALSGVFTERRSWRLRGDIPSTRRLRLRHGGGWDRRSNIGNGFDYRFNGLRNSFGSDNDLLLLGYGRDLEVLCQARHVHADASSLESRDAETIGLILAELIQEVLTAGVDDAVAHRRLRLRPGGCDVLGGSCRLGCHRVAVDYTDTAADELRSGGHEP